MKTIFLIIVKFRNLFANLIITNVINYVLYRYLSQLKTISLFSELDIKGFLKCPYGWGTFAHPTFCSKYYVCVQNIPTLFQCYGSTLFDIRNRKCLERNRVDCENRLDREGLYSIVLLSNVEIYFFYMNTAKYIELFD